MGATTGTYLDRILENTRIELAVRRATTPFAEIERAARLAPRPVGVAGLRANHVTVIAEFKRASPSKGPIAPDADAGAIGRDYVAGGAAAISVLTDARYFGGSLDDLHAVAGIAHSGARPMPVLRKDFVVDVYQLAEARAAGADIVLLIVAALGDAELCELLAAAHALDLAALVEVHDEGELERALAAGASLIGVNNRDLRSFQVDLATTERLTPLAPASVTLVGESGVQTRADVQRLGRAGVHAVLVGESLMRASDRAAAVRELLT